MASQKPYLAKKGFYCSSILLVASAYRYDITWNLPVIRGFGGNLRPPGKTTCGPGEPDSKSHSGSHRGNLRGEQGTPTPAQPR